MKPYLVTIFPANRLHEVVWRHQRTRRDFLLFQDEEPYVGRYTDVSHPRTCWCDTLADATNTAEHISLNNPGVKVVIAAINSVMQTPVDPNAKINVVAMSEKGMLPT